MDYLARAERKAEEKISALQYSRSKIRLAWADYEKKLHGQREGGALFVETLPERVILLSDTLEAPTLENLWNYLSHFYGKLDPAQREQYDFEDRAGIYVEEGVSRLFAVCIRYGDSGGLRTLPAGRYLCADCTEENRQAVLEQLMRTARETYRAEPRFAVQMIVISGILQWNYQVQVYLG